MDWQPPWHVGELETETGVAFEYKILRGSWEAEAVDACGDIPANHHHEVWLDTTLRHTVADWKDRYGGRLITERLHSRVLAGERDLLIWLPPGYAESDRRFPLIVLHDGANVFDPLTSPLSGVDWAADEWVRLLAREGILPKAIVVGVCHPDGYAEENISLREFELSPELGGSAYAGFLTTELVAHMDTHYPTVAEPTARILGGGGLGGLLTFHVFAQYPGVFGNFFGLSTTWRESGPERLTAPLDPRSRAFFDFGTLGGEVLLAPNHALLRSQLTSAGWQEGRDFRIVEVEGGSHDEISWRHRLGEALRFLSQNWKLIN